MKLKATALCLSLIGMGAAGVILAAPQDGPAPTPTAASREPRPGPKEAGGPAAKKQPALRLLEKYVVEPPDVLAVEVLEALPGRPVTGERLVRPDGKISLGFYGDLYVAGLTIPEVKERIVLHLREFVNDDILGLVEMDLDTGGLRRDKAGNVIVQNPRDTDRVFVDVLKSNSKNYYVLGEVAQPGRLPITGNETVLDAINLAGGLTARAEHTGVILYRKDKDGALQGLPVNIDQILMGSDPTTNYQLQPGDRLVIPSRSGAAPDEKSADRPAIRDLERRLGEVERKVDRILEALERRAGK